MAYRPQFPFRAASLALAAALASCILLLGAPAKAASPLDPAVSDAVALYANGRTLAAREALARRLEQTDPNDPRARVEVLEILLELCLRSQSDACVQGNIEAYLKAAAGLPADNSLQGREQTRRTAYYFDAARFSLHSPDLNRQIMADDVWKYENAANPSLYLRRQLLAANIHLSLGDFAQAEKALNRVLSLAASLENPEAVRFDLAPVLSDAIALLMHMGETERAYGVYRATAPMLSRALPAQSVEMAAWRLTEAGLLQETGDLKGSIAAFDAAAAIARQVEMDAPVRERLLATALTLKSVSCTASDDLDCARAALKEHPYAALYARPGRRPASYDEVIYLAARALLARNADVSDPGLAEALKDPISFQAGGGTTALAETYRRGASALLMPSDPARRKAMLEVGRGMAAASEQFTSGVFGGWYRPGATDQLVMRLVLAETAGGGSPADDETVFALVQLLGRSGQTYDADALAALGQAQTELQRRSIHQALRLRARRDRLERIELAKVSALAIASPGSDAAAGHDLDRRRVFRDFAVRLDAASQELAGQGVAGFGANVVALKSLRAVLAPGEAALAVMPTAAGQLAYMCVRRDRVMRTTGPADLARLRLDTRLVQAALTAGHGPSETLDAQYPAEAAVRLYDVLIRPFGDCLKPGDHILWLPGATGVALPLAALLERVPPKLGAGYDLAAADWLVKRHAVSYVGGAALLVAQRTARGAATPAFDFLGVGDPALDGVTASGENRRAILNGGAPATAAPLAELPETRDELERSAAGFRTTRLLLRDTATERRFRGELVGSYRYISLATHGLMRGDLAGLTEPALVLTPVSATDPADDGRLTASEIADLNLAARFVVLSACNTANFDLTQFAKDLPALASAFAVAGVPATLATLWPVDSTTSQAVATSTFVRLRTNPADGPAQALAEAQRGFLAAPPGRAYLHPRFWAPFVVMGDGAADAVATPASVTATSVTRLGETDGEVIALARQGDRTLVRTTGAAASTVQALADSGAVGWRRETPQATRVLLTLDAVVVAGGHTWVGQGRSIAALDSFAPDTGRPSAVWRADADGDRDSFLAAAAMAPDGALALTAAFDARAGSTGAELAVYRLNPGADPVRLFLFPARDVSMIDEATLTLLGDAVLITYTQRFSPDGARPPAREDDFEARACTALPRTRVELRDARTGELRIGKDLPRHLVAAARPDGRGGVFLGGAYSTDCAREPRATVWRLDDRLTLRTLYADAGLGRSEVRALALAPDGRLVLAAGKENLLDYRTGNDAAPSTFSGMVLTLARDGSASPPVMLDSGSNLFVTAVEASDPADILIGGALGGAPAIFHLAAPPNR
jgi:CHAT domain-containing protein/tetratricopeptide (TPR) repeat protein